MLLHDVLPVYGKAFLLFGKEVKNAHHFVRYLDFYAMHFCCTTGREASRGGLALTASIICDYTIMIYVHLLVSGFLQNPFSKNGFCV